MRSLEVAPVLLTVFLACQVTAQVQTPLRVGPFGATHEPLQPVKVPPDLAPFVPKDFILRAVLQTKMSAEGETLLLYDGGESTFPDVHLHAIRHGQDLKLFDGPIAGVAGLLPIRLQTGQQIVGFAYHVGFDEADTTFVIFAAQGDSYRTIFEQKTTTGQMRLLGESPVKFELWSADCKLDRGESCVWCPHRYRVRTYVLERDTFTLTRQRTTATSLYPGDLAEQTFVLKTQK